MISHKNKALKTRYLDHELSANIEIADHAAFRLAINELLALVLTDDKSLPVSCFVWAKASEISLRLESSDAPLQQIPLNSEDTFVEHLKTCGQIDRFLKPKGKPSFYKSSFLQLYNRSTNFTFYPFKTINGYLLGGVLLGDENGDADKPKQSRIAELVAAQIGRHIELEIMRTKYAELTVYLSKASKWKVLAEFASGVAHELNNPLAILQSRLTRIATLIESKKYNEEDMNKQLISSLSVVDRMNRIIRGLRALARDGESLELIHANLNDILLDGLGICEQKLKAHEIELVKKIPPDLSTLCNPTQITQTLVNLINNAVDALKTYSGPKEVSVTGSYQEEWVVIDIANSGPVISEEIRHHIFDPFFSTKSAGEGLGLGLSISANILKAHGGSIQILPDMLQTTFRITLPKK